MNDASDQVWIYTGTVMNKVNTVVYRNWSDAVSRFLADVGQPSLDALQSSYERAQELMREGINRGDTNWRFQRNHETGAVYLTGGFEIIPAIIQEAEVEAVDGTPPSSTPFDRFGWVGAYTMPVPMADNGYVAVAVEAVRIPAKDVQKGDVLVLDGFVTYVTQPPESMTGRDGRSYIHFSGPINIARHSHELLSVIRESKIEDDS